MRQVLKTLFNAYHDDSSDDTLSVWTNMIAEACLGVPSIMKCMLKQIGRHHAPKHWLDPLFYCDILLASGAASQRSCSAPSASARACRRKAVPSARRTASR